MEELAFATVATALGLGPEASLWAEGWEASQACYPRPVPPYLTPAGLAAACDGAGVSAELREVLAGALPEVTRDERLCRLSWHLYRRLFVSPGMLHENLTQWPMLPPGVMPHADLFHVYAYLGGTEDLAARCARRGIPREVVTGTLADLELWVRDYRSRTGRWGLSNLRWLSNHFSGNLFQLGRLQFQFGTFRYPYHGWRERATGRVRLLADSTVRFSPDGLGASTAAALPLGAPYRVTGDAVEGLPVDPRGYALARPERLPAAEWVRVLEPGDPVLNIHIPAGSPMDVGRCGESFRRAEAFYPAHFPEYRYRAYVCGSWLLDPQFERALKPDSNIARFLQEVYLFPLPGAGDQQTFERVFGTARVDPATAPRDTSLRRAILEHVERGGVWRAGGCVLFREEVPRWGCQPYRR